MARTKSKTPEVLQAAAFPLEERGNNSLLYNANVLNWMLNGNSGASTDLAWSYWGKIPELKYVSRYLANAISMATLYVGDTRNINGTSPIRLPDDHVASEALASFAGGFTGQSELLDRLAVHITVAGDSVLIGPKFSASASQPPFDQWRVYSTKEVSSRNGKVYVRMPGNSAEIRIPDSTLGIRIWRQSPVFWADADSPVKGAFTVLREIDLLDQHVHASAISRLAGAGFLGIPEELDLPTPDTETSGTEVDQFVSMLTEVMSLAIKNRDSAAALVPIILRGPAEFIDKIKHFDFSTEFSQMVPELRNMAIRRLALGLDIPPEILLGTASATSWSAFQIEDSAVRGHIVPMLQLITSSLTVGWLRPMLREIPGLKEEDIENYAIHFDISNLKIRQDVTGDAQSLYDRYEIDGEGLRKALGYNESAIPTNEELAKQILLKMISTGQPDLVMYAVKALRDNFGITNLPEVQAPEAEAMPDETVSDEEPAPFEGLFDEGRGPGQPPKSEATKQAEDGPTSVLPGERSKAKQIAPPPVPKLRDDNNN